MSSPQQNKFAGFFLPAVCFLAAAGIISVILLNSYLYPGPGSQSSFPLPSLSPQEESNPGLISINRADLSQLMTLDGIGPTLAQRIIDHREAYGFFNTPEDLLEVPGIGEKTLSAIRDDLSFS